MKRHMLRQPENTIAEKMMSKQINRDDLTTLRQLKSDMKKIALGVSASHSFHAFSGEASATKHHFKELFGRLIMCQNEITQSIKTLKDQ